MKALGETGALVKYEGDVYIYSPDLREWANIAAREAQAGHLTMAVTLGNLRANRGQWKSRSLSLQTLSSSHRADDSSEGRANTCFASLCHRQARHQSPLSVT